MAPSKIHRGINRIKPNTATAIRYKTRPVRTAPKPTAEKPLDLMPSKIAQGTLIVNKGFLSALSSMRNGDLLVKLSERFVKGKPRTENNTKTV